MEIAWQPPPIQRTHTAPVEAAAATAAAFRPTSRRRTANMSNSHVQASPLVHSQGHTSSSYSIQSQPSSRSSDTTQGTAHSTLFPPPPPLPNSSSTMASPVGSGGGGNDVTATDNIMNSVADASSSLFQICVSLRQRLHGVPGFSESLEEEEEDADEDTDPVTLLWRTFRRGYPLILLYNALRPQQPLQFPQDVREDKKGKAATFKFLQACIGDLKFPQEACFIITDLYGDDTTGFVKVARVVNRVLDILVQRNIIEDIRPTASDFEQAEKGMKRTQRQHIVSELVTTERTYVQHLELLQDFKHLVEAKGVIPGDAVHDIFLNLNSLLDFQRRFLIRVEQTNALPEEEQNWGKLFVLYCEAFKVYEPYIANQKKCEKTVVAEYSKLKEAGGSVEMRQMVESPTALYGFLMKPFQRLSKYPLLLEDLFKKGDLDEERKADLMLGKEAATSVLARTNKAVDREEKAEAVQELKMRVEDWKGHRVEGFGELLLYGTFTVVKNESAGSGKDGERQYHVYLFETILLCCKDIDLTKAKNKLSNKQLTDKRGKPKLQLKGRIFMQNVTDLVSLAKPGSYTCQIFWKGDPSIENFIIRFTTDEMMKKWASQIETQRRRYRDRARSSDASGRHGTSATEFEFMRNQPAIENPYALQEDDEEDDVDQLVGGAHSYSRDFSQSRNGSQSSLLSRTTTGESIGMGSASLPPGMVPAPRFPIGSLPMQPQLSIRTRELQAAHSPGPMPADSYFSPTLESPMSSVRTSSSSNNFPFPRQQMPHNAYYEEGHGHTRFTAPAIARQRIPSNTPEAYPSAAARASARATGLHSAQQMPMTARNRSASSPDIHNALRGGPGGAVRVQPGNGQPPVPDMPAPYQQIAHGIPRSQSNSPSLNGTVPSRGMNQSPQLQRERSYPVQSQTPLSHMQDSLPVDSSRYNASMQQQQQQQHAYSTSRTITPTPIARDAFSPPPPPPPPSEGTGPTQLRVKVHCPIVAQSLTLVVPLNISYQSLRDRIDAKLQRSTNLSLSDRVPKEQQVKLKYLDDDDFVSIQSDEDVQTAFETWAEQRSQSVSGMGEIELFCQR